MVSILVWWGNQVQLLVQLWIYAMMGECAGIGVLSGGLVATKLSASVIARGCIPNN